MSVRHFLGLSDAGGDAIAAMINDAQDRKAKRTGWPKGKPDNDQPLAGRVLAMIFEKNSTRTRVSFDIAVRQLGGSAILLDSSTTQLGRGESIADTTRVLSRMVDAIMARSDEHTKLETMARHANVPIINGLTDFSHPCQIVADLLTAIEHGKALPGLEMAWLGDCNNVLNSVIEAAGLMKFTLRIGTPRGYAPDAHLVEQARKDGAEITLIDNADDAIRNADVVLTDTWVSMGERHSDKKLAMLAPFQVDGQRMALAKSDAIFMHCLPAHVGDEVTEEVFEGPQSVVFDEAENRIHAQKSILLWTLGLLD